jgi:hypothetical protein
LSISNYGIDLRALGGVTCITGSLWMSDSNLADLAGLETLQAVGGSITIENNLALTSLNGLGNLKSAQLLRIQNNPILASLAGLGGLRLLSNELAISSNPALPACWADRVAAQVGQTCACSDNTGEESCP